MTSNIVQILSNNDKNRLCSNCGSNETRIYKAKWTRKDGTINQTERCQWFRDGKGGYWCNKCRAKLVENPKWDPIYTAREFTFKGKKLHHEEPLRNGVCAFCGARKGDPHPKTGKPIRTVTAHIEYHDDSPLEDTVELCTGCHDKYDRGIPSDRKCCECESNKTYVPKNGNADWFRNPNKEGEYFCKSCYRKEYDHKKLQRKMKKEGYF